VTTPQARLAPALLGLEEDGPSVVAIGGGRGLAQVLTAVQAYAGEITAIVSIADDGGSSGRLIDGLPIPPPGDARRALLALADPSLLSELFGYRFEGADVSGHSLGNLMLAALTDLTGDFTHALEVAGDLLGARGRVVPASIERRAIEAEVGGRVVRGQAAITKAEGTITGLRLLPDDGDINRAAVEAILRADQVVLAPGSLYTSLVAALLAPGIGDAVNATRAPVVWVLNLCTQVEETVGMTGLDHLVVLEGIAGLRCGGTIVSDRGGFPLPDGIDAVTVDMVEALEYGWALCLAEVAERSAEWPSHDPIRLGRVLADFVRS
jgi:uncharacterized cofD-like protein